VVFLAELGRDDDLPFRQCLDSGHSYTFREEGYTKLKVV
jgi:hypothetical protein